MTFSRWWWWWWWVFFSDNECRIQTALYCRSIHVRRDTVTHQTAFYHYPNTNQNCTSTHTTELNDHITSCTQNQNKTSIAVCANPSADNLGQYTSKCRVAVALLKGCSATTKIWNLPPHRDDSRKGRMSSWWHNGFGVAHSNEISHVIIHPDNLLEFRYVIWWHSVIS